MNEIEQREAQMMRDSWKSIYRKVPFEVLERQWCDTMARLGRARPHTGEWRSLKAKRDVLAELMDSWGK